MSEEFRMDWIEFASRHPGSPFAPKMRHQNIRGKEIVSRVEEEFGTLARWVFETQEKIEQQTRLKVEKINALVAAER